MNPRLHEIGIDKVDGIVIDLGVSSYQLDTAERGFSYRTDAPLDMRMDQRQTTTAKDIVNDYSEAELYRVIRDYGEDKFAGFSYRTDAPLDMRMDQRQTTTAKDIVNDYSEAELYRVIRDYGEDKFAKNIAKHIVMERGKHPIETTGQLNEVIRRAIPMKFQKTSGHPSKRTFQAIRIELNRELDVLRETLDDMIDMLNPGGAIPMKFQKTSGHPSKRTFQAIRIELNRELDVLRETLDDMIDMLNPGGRICIITFHSLEDRIVKSAFRKNENPCTCPSHFPVCVCGNISKGTVITRKPILPSVITRKPILPSEEELMYNSRSKSAKLRIFERS